jgi:chemosensory pili system protein ChpA (sensor histidine kinase/response regulator)
MQPEYLQQILGYYLEDAQNHLAVIEQHLLNLQRTIENPKVVSELFLTARCSIVGGANMLPISSTYISSIHKTGFCLADCFQVLQQQGSVKVDQKLEDLLMQVFYTLKGLIEQLKEPSGLTDDKATQVIVEIEPTRKALMAHLNWLVQQSHRKNQPDVAIASDSDDDILSLEDLESLLDKLSEDSASANLEPSSEQDWELSDIDIDID